MFFAEDPAGVGDDPVNGWTSAPMAEIVTFHGNETIKPGTVVDEPPLG